MDLEFELRMSIVQRMLKRGRGRGKDRGRGRKRMDVSEERP
jgi:hypothetical protein